MRRMCRGFLQFSAAARQAGRSLTRGSNLQRRGAFFASRLLLTAWALAVGCEPSAARGSMSAMLPPFGGGPRSEAPAADLSEVGRSNVAFTLDLYRALQSDGPGNQFYSPHSIQAALAMTHAGARGGTADEMAGALHIVLPQDRLHAAMHEIDLNLTRGTRSDARRPAAVPLIPLLRPETSQLRIANALWGSVGADFHPDFLATLEKSYGSGVRRVDFAGDPDGARRSINAWVSERTARRISDILTPGAVRPDTRLALVNAIYFKADWQTSFDPGRTQPDLFHRLDGTTTPIKLMRAKDDDKFSYAETAEYQAVELPYEGSELAMLILLPPAGAFSAVGSSLSPERVQAMVDGLRTTNVHLSMPKFRMEPEVVALRPVLQRLGMSAAFDTRADFSGMAGDRCPGDAQCLHVDDVFHKAFVEVDESGTEAAAGTISLFMPLGARIGVPVMQIDRPFIFFIRDRATGVLLFGGSLVNPAASGVRV